MESFYGKALVIDNNLKFLDEIKKDDELLASYPCLFSRTFQEASQLLRQNNNQIRVIFISSAISKSFALEELNVIRMSRPHLPVILISHAPEKDPPEIKSPAIGFTKYLEQPEDFKPIAREMDILFKSKEAWNDILANQDEKNVELNLPTEDYVPTFLADFILTPKSYFNVYVRIGKEKFIKILNAGDPMQENLISGYAKKGITHLFIPVHEQKKYISLCEEVSRKLINRIDINTEIKVRSVLNLGANISKNLNHTGITPEKLDFANNFLNQTVVLIKSLKLEQVTLKTFLENIQMKEHSSAISFLAGIIANEVGFESSKSVKLVGMTALVHDIGLYDLDPEFIDEKQYLKSPDKKDLFDRHAKHGADLLRKNGGFEEVICQAVEQHHMRRRGNDPLRRTNNINMITEIIGVADELQNLLSKDDFKPVMLNEFRVKTLNDFSPQIEKAVVKLLQKKI